MKPIEAKLTRGVLAEYREKIIHSVLYQVNPYLHAKTYEGNQGNDMYAEPEFTGKYVDICMELYRNTGDEKALENAKIVVGSILKHQRKDGYLGCLPDGKETLNFGVWNQAFTILGLLSYYKVTKDKRILDAALKSVSYTMRYFIDEKRDILDALNYGTQHISILLPLCKLYEITNNAEIKGYIFYIVERIKTSDLNFFDFEDILKLRSKKGIENFVVLLGILEYARLFGDDAAVVSVEKYWQQLCDTQIRNTGNGTINELWTEGGGACMLLSSDVKPNETCVAVGWIELSLTLFYLTQESKYLDAIDKTLYNHVLASVADDGSDFAYYQPNFGKKVRVTEYGMYKCCRYRGFTLFSYMNEMLFYEDEKQVIPMIYTSGIYQSNDIKIQMETDYPYNPTVVVSVNPRKNKLLKLRVPQKCEFANLEIDGTKSDKVTTNGYVEIELKQDETTKIKLVLANQILFEEGKIGEKKYAACSYGPILLAAEHMQTNEMIKEPLRLEQATSDSSHKIGFRAQGEAEGEKTTIQFCEYSSADDYNVWIETK